MAAILRLHHKKINTSDVAKFEYGMEANESTLLRDTPLLPSQAEVKPAVHPRRPKTTLEHVRPNASHRTHVVCCRWSNPATDGIASAVVARAQRAAVCIEQCRCPYHPTRLVPPRTKPSTRASLSGYVGSATTTVTGLIGLCRRQRSEGARGRSIVALGHLRYSITPTISMDRAP